MIKRAITLSCALLAFLCAACVPPDEVVPDANDSSAAARIGPEGGALELGRAVTIIVPPGALTAATELSVAESQEAAPPGFRAASPVYRFGPEGTVFAVPIEVRIRASGAAALRTVLWSTEDPLRYEDVGVSSDGDVFAGSVSHFSLGFVGELGEDVLDAGQIDAGSDGGEEPDAAGPDVGHEAGPQGDDAGSSTDGGSAPPVDAGYDAGPNGGTGLDGGNGQDGGTGTLADAGHDAGELADAGAVSVGDAGSDSGTVMECSNRCDSVCGGGQACLPISDSLWQCGACVTSLDCCSPDICIEGQCRFF